VAELASLVADVDAAAGFAGFGAGGSWLGVAGGAADAPAPGASVRDTSAFNGSAGAVPAGLSAAAVGGVAAGGAPAAAAACSSRGEPGILPESEGGFCWSSAI